MSGVYLIIGLMLGVVIYRLGRKEGERGKVAPLVRGVKRESHSVGLLEQIERYDGKEKG